VELQIALTKAGFQARNSFQVLQAAGRVSEKVSHGSGSVVLLRATAKGGQWLA
jgi:hypothetical protein